MTTGALGHARVLAGSARPIVEVGGLGEVYDGKVLALADIDPDVPGRKLTSFLGPSGRGKTRLLEIIAGPVEPTSGQVQIEGRRARGPGPERAFVFRDFALLPWRTVLANVAFGLELRGASRREREERARHWIREVGRADFEHAYPHRFPAGCASAEASPARSRSMPGFFRWTSPSRPSTNRPGGSSERISRSLSLRPPRGLVFPGRGERARSSNPRSAARVISRGAAATPSISIRSRRSGAASRVP